MHTLLEQSERMPYHTDLGVVFRALGGAQRDFDWVLTDLEVIGELGPALAPLADLERQGALCLTGDALTAAVEEGEPLQFAWGVLSGFAPGGAPAAEALDPYPYADGNPALWQPGVTLQHPAARLEIVCWDSSATLLLSREPELARRFREYFPEAVDLEAYNVAVARRGRER